MVIESGCGTEFRNAEVDFLVRAGSDKNGRSAVGGSELDGGYSDTRGTGVDENLDLVF